MIRKPRGKMPTSVSVCSLETQGGTPRGTPKGVKAQVTTPIGVPLGVPPNSFLRVSSNCHAAGCRVYRDLAILSHRAGADAQEVLEQVRAFLFLRRRQGSRAFDQELHLVARGQRRRRVAVAQKLPGADLFDQVAQALPEREIGGRDRLAPCKRASETAGTRGCLPPVDGGERSRRPPWQCSLRRREPRAPAPSSPGCRSSRGLLSSRRRGNRWPAWPIAGPRGTARPGKTGPASSRRDAPWCRNPGASRVRFVRAARFRRGLRGTGPWPRAGRPAR